MKLAALNYSHFNWIKIVLSTDLPLTSKALAMYLATFMNMNQDMAWPSLNRIEKELTVTRKTVIKHIDILAAEGFLMKTSGNSTKNNQYTAILPKAFNQMLGSNPERLEKADSSIKGSGIDPLGVVDSFHQGSGTTPPQVVDSFHQGSGTTPPQVVEPFHPNRQYNKSSNKKEKNKQKRKIPPDFSISTRVRQWAEKKEYHHLEDHFENFVLASTAKGYKYVDWDSAFMNAIRNNWAKVDKKSLNEVHRDAYRQIAGQVDSCHLREVSPSLRISMDESDTGEGYFGESTGMEPDPWELHS